MVLPAATTSLTYVGHATILIEIGGMRLLTDPLLRDRVLYLRRHGRSVDASVYANLDAVLISHLHYDHCDLPSLRMLPQDSRMIVPRGSRQLFHAWGFQSIDELEVGEVTRVGPVTVRATEARHSGYRPPGGPAASALGFIVESSHQQIYFAGDTDLFAGMAALQGRLDVALLPVWGWGPSLGAGHMNPRRAADALTLLRPRIAIPIHWGTLYPIGLRWLKPARMFLPPVEFSLHAAKVAPEVTVQILQPGQTFRLLE